jgi:hypothetical protein
MVNKYNIHLLRLHLAAAAATAALTSISHALMQHFPFHLALVAADISACIWDWLMTSLAYCCCCIYSLLVSVAAAC